MRLCNEPRPTYTQQPNRAPVISSPFIFMVLDLTRDHDINAVRIGLGRKIARLAGSGGYSVLLNNPSI